MTEERSRFRFFIAFVPLALYSAATITNLCLAAQNQPPIIEPYTAAAASLASIIPGYLTDRVVDSAIGHFSGESVPSAHNSSYGLA